MWTFRVDILSVRGSCAMRTSLVCLLLMCYLASKADTYTFSSSSRFLPHSLKSVHAMLDAAMRNSKAMTSAERSIVEAGAANLAKGSASRGMLLICREGGSYFVDQTQTGEVGATEHREVLLVPRGLLTRTGDTIEVSDSGTDSPLLTPAFRLALLDVPLSQGPGVSQRLASGLEGETYVRSLFNVATERTVVRTRWSGKTQVRDLAVSLLSTKGLWLPTAKIVVSRQGTGVRTVDYTAYSNSQPFFVGQYKLLSTSKTSRIPSLRQFCDGSRSLTDYRLTPGAPEVKLKVARKVVYAFSLDLPSVEQLRRIEQRQREQVHVDAASNSSFGVLIAFAFALAALLSYIAGRRKRPQDA